MFDWHCKHCNRHVELLLAAMQLVKAVDGDAAYACAHQLGVDVEACHDVEPVLGEAHVLHQGGSQAACAYHEGVVLALEAQEVYQLAHERVHLVAYARLALDVEKRQVLGDLRGVDVDFLGNLCRRHIFYVLVVEHFHIGQIPR